MRRPSRSSRCLAVVPSPRGPASFGADMYQAQALSDGAAPIGHDSAPAPTGTWRLLPRGGDRVGGRPGERASLHVLRPNLRTARLETTSIASTASAGSSRSSPPGTALPGPAGKPCVTTTAHGRLVWPRSPRPWLSDAPWLPSRFTPSPCEGDRRIRVRRTVQPGRPSRCAEPLSCLPATSAVHVEMAAYADDREHRHRPDRGAPRGRQQLRVPSPFTFAARGLRRHPPHRESRSRRSSARCTIQLAARRGHRRTGPGERRTPADGRRPATGAEDAQIDVGGSGAARPRTRLLRDAADGVDRRGVHVPGACRVRVTPRPFTCSPSAPAGRRLLAGGARRAARLGLLLPRARTCRTAETYYKERLVGVRDPSGWTMIAARRPRSCTSPRTRPHLGRARRALSCTRRGPTRRAVAGHQVGGALGRHDGRGSCAPRACTGSSRPTGAWRRASDNYVTHPLSGGMPRRGLAQPRAVLRACCRGSRTEQGSSTPHGYRGPRLGIRRRDAWPGIDLAT